MASSLEDLLAEEGFRGRRSTGMMRESASFRSDTVTFFPFRDKHKKDSSSSSLGQKAKIERSRSNLVGNKKEGCSGRRSKDGVLRRDKFDGKLRTMNWDRLGQISSKNAQEGRRRINVDKGKEIEEIQTEELGQEADEKVKDIYSDKEYSSDRRKQSVQGSVERDRYQESRKKDLRVDLRHSENLRKDLLKYTGSSDGSRNSMKRPEKSQGSAAGDSRNSQSIEDNNRRMKQENAGPVAVDVALDEVAVQAMVSILNGHIKNFFKDEEFRTMLRTNCFSSIGIPQMEEDQRVESKVISTLEQAIAAVEKVAEDAATAKDLKKASMQLSVISGLNSNETKDGYTSGVRNSVLSACAHVYLSVIYKLHKKDRISAKHLLQVFCDSPSLARSLLLPELWEYLFLPHLSPLKLWYNQEVEALQSTPSRMRKLKLLDKVYNEILDSGTYQFAAYYKDWITEGIEAPSLPSIHIPTMSVKEVHPVGSQDHLFGLESPSDSFSPQTMVNKKLYDAVFGRLVKPGDQEAKSSRGAVDYEKNASFSDGSPTEVKQTLPYSSEMTKRSDKDEESHSLTDAQDHDNNILSESEEDWKRDTLIVSPDLLDETGNSNLWQEAAGDAEIEDASSHTSKNEQELKSLAKSFFEQQQTDDFGDPTISTESSSQSKAMNLKAAYKEIHEHYNHLGKELSIASIPPDFICPLTGKLFEDPVTLETGQTFERVGIIEWFSKGNKTCPLTERILECQTVPCTNSILKRVIDSWKSEHCRHVIAFASQIPIDSVEHESRRKDEAAVLILEELPTAFSEEERLTNANHLISLRGLDFLIRRFRLGDFEEKAYVATLLSCYMEANSGCRNKIIKNIDRQCLFELLYSKDHKFRGKAVQLLLEFVCLSRKKESVLFLSGLASKDMVKIMHIVLVFLQSSPLDQKPPIAILLLHLDLMVESKKYSVYRQEAVDAIAVALEASLTNKKIREQCCKALFILGGHFSASGKLLTEKWILQQAGYSNDSEVNYSDVSSETDDHISTEGEEEGYEQWLKNLSASLFGSGRWSLLETISKCLCSKNLDLVRACLTTVAWLSGTLSSLSDADFQTPAFSALISGLKESLDNGEQMEHKVLASVSLLNFSKIPECRVLLMTIADEIAGPLRSIAQVTWTARQLYGIISGEDISSLD